MKYLLILDAALFTLAGTMAMVLAVVWLIYGFNLDASARVATEMHTVAITTLSFSLLTATLGLAFWSLLRKQPWHWWAQLVAAVSVAAGSMFLYRLLTV